MGGGLGFGLGLRFGFKVIVNQLRINGLMKRLSMVTNPWLMAYFPCPVVIPNGIIDPESDILSINIC